MFIQLLASGTSQQNYSVCKFNLWAITSNRRLLCRRDGGVCQSVGPHGLIGILSKHKGMMGELRSKCPCHITLCFCASLFVIFNLGQFQCIECAKNLNNHTLESLCPCLFCAPQLVVFVLCTSSIRSYRLRVSDSVLPSVSLRGNLWKISDLLSRLDCRTWTGPNSSLQTLFLVSVLLIYVSERKKHFRNEGMCVFVPVLVPCLSAEEYPASLVYDFWRQW